MGRVVCMSQGGDIDPELCLDIDDSEYRVGEWRVPLALVGLADDVLYRRGDRMVHVDGHRNEHGRLCFYMGMGIGL